MIPSALLFINILIARTAAHGYMSQPPAVYNDPFTQTNYITRVSGPAVYPGLKWDDSPAANSDQLAKKIESGGFPLLRSFTNIYVHECPFNDLSKPIDVDHLTTFQWQNDQEQKGFVPSHEGPCELWIDSQRIFNNTNCARRYTAYPAIIPIDYSACTGTCRLEFYWMTMQEPMWQLYKGCATIVRTSKAPAGTPTAVPATAPTGTPTAVGTTVKLSCTTVSS